MCKMREMTDKELFSKVFGVREDTIRFDDISDLMTAPRAIEGVGGKRAEKVYAVQEIARRLMMKSDRKRDTVSNPDCAADVAYKATGYYETRERFNVIVLNTKNHVLGIEEISVGTLDASLVHPREVFQAVLKYPASAFIIFHNHPSGDPSPSRDHARPHHHWDERRASLHQLERRIHRLLRDASQPQTSRRAREVFRLPWREARPRSQRRETGDLPFRCAPFQTSRFLEWKRPATRPQGAAPLATPRDEPKKIARNR